MFKFIILKKDKKSLARVGVLNTPHGKIETPHFIPVATKGTLRGVSFLDFKKMGGRAVFLNTFHFFINQAYKKVKKIGGLHKFLSCNFPLFTDSGGFQVFSLGYGREEGVGKIAGIFPNQAPRAISKKQSTRDNLIKIDSDGIVFSSPLDGKEHRLTPSLSIKIQKILGADIIFTFDECTSPLASYEYTRKALERTHHWAILCLKEFGSRKSQALFGIVQGGEWKDLRETSAEFVSSLPFFGIAIGGSLGKSKLDMYRILEWTIPKLPPSKPRHLLGIGRIEDIFEAVSRGVDLFDCVEPTRLARRGVAFTRQGFINLKKSIFSITKEPIEKECCCLICQTYSRAYLHHLIREREITAVSLLAYHNLFFIIDLMKKIRKSILEDKFLLFKKHYLKKLKKR